MRDNESDEDEEGDDETDLVRHRERERERERESEKKRDRHLCIYIHNIYIKRERGIDNIFLDLVILLASLSFIS